MMIGRVNISVFNNDEIGERQRERMIEQVRPTLKFSPSTFYDDRKKIVEF